MCQRLQLYIKSRLKSHYAQEIQSCQMLLLIKKPWTVWKYHTVFRHLFQTSCWTFWSLIQPYFLLLPFYFYRVIILPIVEISDFFATFFILWHYHLWRKSGKFPFIKELNFLIIKWSILSKQLFQVKLNMTTINRFTFCDILIFLRGVKYPDAFTIQNYKTLNRPSQTKCYITCCVHSSYMCLYYVPVDISKK